MSRVISIKSKNCAVSNTLILFIFLNVFLHDIHVVILQILPRPLCQILDLIVAVPPVKRFAHPWSTCTVLKGLISLKDQNPSFVFICFSMESLWEELLCINLNRKRETIKEKKKATENTINRGLLKKPLSWFKKSCLTGLKKKKSKFF